MSERSLGLLVEDIWESIEKIERYTEGMTQDSFQSDEKTTDAVVRNLEIIGEAAGRLPKKFTDRHSFSHKKRIPRSGFVSFIIGADGQSWDRLMLKSQIFAKQTEADNLKSIKPLTVQP